ATEGGDRAAARRPPGALPGQPRPSPPRCAVSARARPGPTCAQPARRTRLLTKLPLKPATITTGVQDGGSGATTLWMDFRAWRSQPARLITGTCVAGSLDR